MERLKLRYHHAEMFNNVALLSDPEWGEHVEEVMRRDTPIRDTGMDFLKKLSERYDNWNDIQIKWMEGPDDLCANCDGLNDDFQCEWRYSFDDPKLSLEQNRKQADRRIQEKYPGLMMESNLREVHRRVVKQLYG